jgi:hypothetical protein
VSSNFAHPFCRPTHPPRPPPPLPACSPYSGLLTIGPRFGGAIDDAARYFKQAADQGQEADAFVESMKRRGIRWVGWLAGWLAGGPVGQCNLMCLEAGAGSGGGTLSSCCSSCRCVCLQT